MQQLRIEFGVTKKSESPAGLPILINYHDDVTKRLKHLDKTGDDFIPLDCELEMLRRYPIVQLLNPEPISESVLKERAARLHELLHFLRNGSHSHAGNILNMVLILMQVTYQIWFSLSCR